MRLYYLRHGYEYANTYLTHNLTVLAFTTFAQLASAVSTAGSVEPQCDLEPEDGPEKESTTTPSTEDARSAVILAATGLCDQGKNYYAPLPLLQLVLSRLGESDQSLLHTLVDVGQESANVARQRPRHGRAQFSVAVISIINHPEKVRLGGLVKQYAGLAIEQQSPGESGSNSPTD